MATEKKSEKAGRPLSPEAAARLHAGQVKGAARGGAATAEKYAFFPDAESFRAAADAYFDECDRKDELYGEAGLCLYLSRHNRLGRTVRLEALRNWYDGIKAPYLQDAVQEAYLRIQAQIESDERYREKGGMASRAIFLQKQTRLGGYQDKVETKQDTTVRIVHGTSVDASDFE